LDESFKETHMQILERFFILFQNIYEYGVDYTKFIVDLESGLVFIQQTLQSVVKDVKGKQLLSEGLYLFGVMLLLVDMKIPGEPREKLIMSYYRYKGKETDNIDQICKLFKRTGFVTGQPWPKLYPCDYFSRFSISKDLVSMLIGKLRSDDVYLQTNFYPLPDHRSTALFTQSSMLYVILYFKPDTLKTEKAIMREIIDKFFPDNWVITYFMGHTVDISTTWNQYNASNLGKQTTNKGLQNTIQLEQVELLTKKHVKFLKESIEEVEQYLKEGVLSEENVLDNILKLLDCLRQCNVTLRWLILHRTSENKKIKGKEINKNQSLYVH
jgi:WASH complex subunit strumpellin